MPRDPPVTTATWFSRLICMSFGLNHCFIERLSD
jgi:hypothetical protein